jgi:exodeoxyribonuclease VII large subunit
MSNSNREIFTVSALNHAVSELLSDNFPLIWVEGEISNIARPASGHLYFSLKDENAQIRCAMFRGKNRLLDFAPENGDQVLVRARVSLYEPRGDFQLVAEHMEQAGDGALRRAFEELKQKLQKEGLFDPGHKQEIPELPRQIGVVTSPSGAAIRDILTVLKRRFPAIPVLIYPVPVQGDGAAEKIAQAIELANKRNDCDVLLVSRGGGSLEDLWEFNEERLARAIYTSEIPVVSAVGHEVDVTISDFVADTRAPTPSAAAELLSPDQLALRNQFLEHQQRLVYLMTKHQEQLQQRVDWLSKRLQSPSQRLQQYRERLKHLSSNLKRTQFDTIKQLRTELFSLHSGLKENTPAHRVKSLFTMNENFKQRIQRGIKTKLELSKKQLGNYAHALEAVSPLATLGRGYSIIRTNKTLLRSVEETQVGAKLDAQLVDGHLQCIVETIHKDKT